jgi:hypothetical protein
VEEEEIIVVVAEVLHRLTSQVLPQLHRLVAQHLIHHPIVIKNLDLSLLGRFLEITVHGNEYGWLMEILIMYYIVYKLV